MVGFVDTHDNQKNYNQKQAAKDPGPYVATVKFTDDPLRQGRLGVNIPEITKTQNPTIDDCIWCQYLSPFYGAKSVEANDRRDPDDYKGTQHTYGMWFVPPDIDTQVLVIFARGELSQKNAFWIGCVQQPLTNHQVPAYGSTSETIRSRQDARELAGSGQTNYGTDFLPVGEKNRKIIEEAQTEEYANSLLYPINDVLADQLLSEGLVQDTVRGTTSSSARRESPSQVFGINTPGRIRADSRSKNIGPEGATVRPDRNPGHSFVMDDGDVAGDNQLTRIRTASGHQLLFHDTIGTVYIANGSGKSWIEMDHAGRISVYSNKGISMRTGGDFNLHADKNINFHAKEKINFSAQGNVVLNSEEYVYVMGNSGILSSSQSGSVRHFAREGISSYTEGKQLHGAKGQFHLQGSQVHFNMPMGRPGSGGGTSIEDWGPTWLKPSSKKIDLQPVQVTDIVATEPIDARGGVVRTEKTLTTVKDSTTNKSQGVFITHEPYTRAKSEKEQVKEFVDTVMESIEKANPKLTSTELTEIKNKLSSANDVDSVIKTVKEISNLDPKVVIKTTVLNELNKAAEQVKQEIKDALSDLKSEATDTIKNALGL